MKKQLTIYAFIDSQNLNLGTSKDMYKKGKRIHSGWKLDFNRFRKYLQNKFRVKKAFLFMGYIKKNEKLYRSLKSFGYEIIFKPTVLLKPFQTYKTFIIFEKEKLEFKH